MKFKIDENIAESVKRYLTWQGHDCHSVYDEGIQGGTDDELAAMSAAEKRTLITLDLDFADIVSYPPESSPGIIVLRLNRQDGVSIISRLKQIFTTLSEDQIDGHLILVSEKGVRIR